MYLKTFKRWLHFLGEQKNSHVFHFCACFHAWVADHVITFYDRVFALPRCQVPASQAFSFSINSFLTTEVTRNAQASRNSRQVIEPTLVEPKFFSSVTLSFPVPSSVPNSRVVSTQLIKFAFLVSPYILNQSSAEMALRFR